MTCAVSAAVREGAEAVICASTGNTAASAAAYAARAGLRGAVIVPEGKIATGKLAQALMHGARVIALRGNFDQALDARARARPTATRSRSSTRSTSSASRARRRRRSRSSTSSARRSTRSASRSATPATSPPTGRASREYGRRAADARLPGRGRGAARARRAGREPGDGRQRDPHRQPGALGGGDGRDDRLARRGPRGHRRRRSSTPTACWPRDEGVFCEPASAAVGRRPARARRRRAPSGSCACSPATA